VQVQRYSRQREAILCNLKERSDHPCADMVYESIRLQIPNISLGTVYRNLKALADDGSIIRFNVGNKERFDGNTTPHIHFFCECCGEIRDVFHDSVNAFVENMSQLLDCTVSGAHLVITGKCEICPKTIM
jgi:Fe2+ or Zn2+ uptake regulation protein